MTEHEWLALAAPYALDALSGDERAAFEAHLAQCAQCRAEVASFREVAARVATAVPEAAPSAELRARVLAEARGARPIGRRRPWLALAAGVALAVLLGAAWLRERGARRLLEQQIAQVRDSLAGRDSLLASVVGPGIGTADLAATGKPPSARLFWDPARRRIVVAVFALPPAPAGRTYQLWAIATGQAPVSLGVFNTGPDGRLLAGIPAPADLVFQVAAVTEEPAGGSPQPTQSPFLLGSIQRTE
jgi:anti-sigma-K factor RskA